MKREGTRRQHKACGETAHTRRGVKVPENNVKDDLSEAKVNDVMGEKRSTNEVAWKPLETRPHRREW